MVLPKQASNIRYWNIWPALTISLVTMGRHEAHARKNELRLANEKYPVQREERKNGVTTSLGPLIDLSPEASNKRVEAAIEKDVAEANRGAKQSVPPHESPYKIA